MRTARSSRRRGGLHQAPPWTEFLTHAYENITLSQTSFAGGNNDIPGISNLTGAGITWYFTNWICETKSAPCKKRSS